MYVIEVRVWILADSIQGRWFPAHTSLFLKIPQCLCYRWWVCPIKNRELFVVSSLKQLIWISFLKTKRVTKKSNWCNGDISQPARKLKLSNRSQISQVFKQGTVLFLFKSTRWHCGSICHPTQCWHNAGFQRTNHKSLEASISLCLAFPLPSFPN